MLEWFIFQVPIAVKKNSWYPNFETDFSLYGVNKLSGLGVSVFCVLALHCNFAGDATRPSDAPQQAVCCTVAHTVYGVVYFFVIS